MPEYGRFLGETTTDAAQQKNQSRSALMVCLCLCLCFDCQLVQRFELSLSLKLLSSAESEREGELRLLCLYLSLVIYLYASIAPAIILVLSLLAGWPVDVLVVVEFFLILFRFHSFSKFVHCARCNFAPSVHLMRFAQGYLCSVWSAICLNWAERKTLSMRERNRDFPPVSTFVKLTLGSDFELTSAGAFTVSFIPLTIICWEFSISNRMPCTPSVTVAGWHKIQNTGYCRWRYSSAFSQYIQLPPLKNKTKCDALSTNAVQQFTRSILSSNEIHWEWIQFHTEWTTSHRSGGTRW